MGSAVSTELNIHETHIVLCVVTVGVEMDPVCIEMFPFKYFSHRTY